MNSAFCLRTWVLHLPVLCQQSHWPENTAGVSGREWTAWEKKEIRTGTQLRKVERELWRGFRCLNDQFGFRRREWIRRHTSAEHSWGASLGMELRSWRASRTDWIRSSESAARRWSNRIFRSAADWRRQGVRRDSKVVRRRFANEHLDRVGHSNYKRAAAGAILLVREADGDSQRGRFV